MKEIDYKKELEHLYNSCEKTVEIVDVAEENFFVIDGQGDPSAALCPCR